MRKFLLVSASIFALGASGAMAEQSTTVNDSSEGSVNEITQTAGGTDSSILVTQTGDGSDAPGTPDATSAVPAGTNVLIDQASDDDSVIDVTQDGMGDGNSIFIDQDAFGGFSMVTTTQMGEANQAEIVQTAAGADVMLEQHGNENIATVTQMDDDNVATVNQWGEMNMASVLQDGVGNDATVDQGADGDPMDENTAEVFQHGTDSFVVVSQLGSNNMASATQNAGVENEATITINQSGTGGSTTVTQNGPTI